VRGVRSREKDERYAASTTTTTTTTTTTMAGKGQAGGAVGVDEGGEAAGDGAGRRGRETPGRY